MPLAIGIFALVLAAIASDRFDRTKVALAGAIAVLLTQTIDRRSPSRQSIGTPSACSPG